MLKLSLDGSLPARDKLWRLRSCEAEANGFLCLPASPRSEDLGSVGILDVKGLLGTPRGWKAGWNLGSELKISPEASGRDCGPPGKPDSEGMLFGSSGNDDCDGKPLGVSGKGDKPSELSLNGDSPPEVSVNDCNLPDVCERVGNPTGVCERGGNPTDVCERGGRSPDV